MAWAALAWLLVGLGGALVAQFPLDGWSEGSALHHWVQHGLIFFGGLVAGAALVRLYQLGQRSA